MSRDDEQALELEAFKALSRGELPPPAHTPGWTPELEILASMLYAVLVRR